MNKDPRDVILDFAIAYDLILMNTWFKKIKSHLITFKVGQKLVKYISTSLKK